MNNYNLEEIKKSIISKINNDTRSPNIKKLAYFIEKSTNFDVNLHRYKKRPKSGLNKKVFHGYVLTVKKDDTVIFTHDTINFYGDTLLSVCLFIKREILDKEKE